MHKPLALTTLLALAATAGCGTNRPVTRVETPANVTHEVAFGDYRRVFNTTYHILNRYGVIQTSSYRYGEITALLSEDTSMFDKTRRTVQARIFDAGDYYEVECHVLIAIEDSEVATFQGQFQPRYDWKTIAKDPALEVRLNHEIRAALSGGAWQAKEPLTPLRTVPAAPAPDPAPVGPAPRSGERRREAPRAHPNHPDQGTQAAPDTDEVRVTPRPGRGAAEQPGAEAWTRLGLVSLRLGEWARAAAAFEASLEADRGDPFAPFLLAQARFSAGDWDAAVVTLQRGARRAGAWLDAGVDVRAFYREADETFARQLAALGAATRDDPALRVLAGYMRLVSGDDAGALRELDLALEARPGCALTTELRDRAVARLAGPAGLAAF